MKALEVHCAGLLGAMRTLLRLWTLHNSFELPVAHAGPAGAPGPPKNIFEAAERGMVGFIVKAVERTLEFNINQRVSSCAFKPMLQQRNRSMPCSS